MVPNYGPFSLVRTLTFIVLDMWHKEPSRIHTENMT